MESRSNGFFFQAEDGIRDLTVTGVQTCALPIWACCRCPEPDTSGSPLPEEPDGSSGPPSPSSSSGDSSDCASIWSHRSEERRVGKECRSRRPTHHSKDNVEERAVNRRMRQ